MNVIASRVIPVQVDRLGIETVEWIAYFLALVSFSMEMVQFRHLEDLENLKYFEN